MTLAAQPASLEFEIVGAQCDSCADRAIKTLKKLPGVTNVTLDAMSSHVRIDATRALTMEEVRLPLKKLGFDIRLSEDPKLQRIPQSERARLDIRAIPRDASLDLKRDLAGGKITVVSLWADRCESCYLLIANLEWVVFESSDVALRTVELREGRTPASQQALRQFRVSALPYVRVYDRNERYVGEVNGGTMAKVRALIDKARKR